MHPTHRHERPLGLGWTLCLAGLLAWPSAAYAQRVATAVYGTPQATVATQPRGLEAADLDGDGHLDVIVALEQADYVDVRFGNSSGHFDGARSEPSVADGPRALAVADFNRDGRLDIAVGHCRAATVWILLGEDTGRAHFASNPDRASPAWDCIQSLVAVDASGDGVPDVVAASASGVRVLVSDGSGGFLPDPVDLLPDGWFGLAAGDLDRDGDLDVVAAGFDGLRVLLNTGAGLVLAWSADAGTGVDVALGDVDGDGLLDAAMAGPLNAVTVGLGNGTGGFVRVESLAVDGRATRVQIADLDADGRGEVIAVARPTESGPDRLAIFRLERLRDRFVMTSQEIGRSTFALRVARLDRDLAPDIVMTNGVACVGAACAGPGEITVLLNRGLHGIGAYKTSALGAPNPLAMAGGDLNGDGVLDLVVTDRGEDLSVLINDGAGHFAATVIPIAGMSIALGLAVGDVDGDGDGDIVVGDSWRVVLLRNSGDGTFAPFETVTSTLRVAQLALTDMDGDGDLDIVLLSVSGLAVLVNGGGGSFPFDFEPTPVRDLAETFTIATLSSGILGIAVSAHGGFATGDSEFGVDIYVYSDGTIYPTSSASTGALPRALASGDFDGDGSDEIVVAAEGVQLLRRSTVGYTRTFLSGSSRAANGVTVADVDLDGALDIVASEGSGSGAPSEGVTIWRGDGAGGFSAATPYLAGSNSIAVAAGRLTLRDSGPGLAVLDAARQNVWALLQGFGNLIDTDFDLLPDLLEPMLGFDPLEMDSDDDGLMDGIDPDALRAAIATIPPAAWRTPGQQRALEAVLYVLDPLVRLRRAELVQRALALHSSRYDGCSSAKKPDKSDWVIDCGAQDFLQAVNSTLSGNLGAFFSGPQPVPAKVVNVRPSRGGVPPEVLPPPRGNAPPPRRDDDRGPLPPVPSCGAGMELFTTLPTALVDLPAVIPMGFTSPPRYTLPIPWIYPVSRTDPLKGAPEWLPLLVVSPADVRVVAVARTTDPHTGFTDYAVYLRPCLEVRLQIQHLQGLASVLADAVADIDTMGTPLGNGVLVREVDIPLDAGATIGISQQGGYGLGLVDERAPELPFANPDRYRLSDAVLDAMTPAERRVYERVSIQPLRQVCPVDYFAEPARTALAALFGDVTGQARRLVAPACGEHEQDEPGTARGNWFAPGASALTGQHSGSIALVGDAVDPGQPVFSVSTVFGIGPVANAPPWPAGEYLFSPAPAPGTRINERFEHVKAGAVYCYDGLRGRNGAPLDGVVLLELLAGANGEPAARLRTERQPVAQSCASLMGWAWTGNARIFER